MRSFRECVAGRGAARAGQACKKHIRPLVPADSTKTNVAPNQGETDSAGPAHPQWSGGAIRRPLGLPVDGLHDGLPMG